MKPVFVLLLASCLAAMGQSWPEGFREEHELRIAQARFVPLDPWRSIQGSVHYAKGDLWYQFFGRVIGQSEGKTYIHGWYGLPLEYGLDRERHFRVFCVTNLPAAVVGETLLADQNLTALNLLRSTTYYSAEFGAQPCLMLDYGAVWTPPPPTPEEIAAAQSAAAAAKAQADAVKKKADDAALKYNLDLAAKGDAYGQFRMGERYRDGDGVPKDLAKAREMFTLSSAQGNTDADAALAKLPPP